MSRVAHVGRSRGLGFAGGRGGPAAYDIRVIGVLPPRDAGAIRVHGLGAAGLSADERRAGAKGFFNFQGKSDLAMSTIWPTWQARAGTAVAVLLCVLRERPRVRGAKVVAGSDRVLFCYLRNPRSL